ncbi:MAG TPA: DUF4982 domain-containing protein, partial [Anseongella sp.]|nr:DUF4982 domain-containing protein [Anseongella sp.]
ALAELFLNGKSLGVRKMDASRQIVWNVPYQPGTLTAIARNDGKIAAEAQVSTAGKPAAIQLLADKEQASANKLDVIHVEVNIIDKNGHIAPESDNLVEFGIRGPGKIIGVENGDITDFSSMKAHRRKAFKGKCLVMIQTTDQPGKIRLKASSQGLDDATVQILSR